MTLSGKISLWSGHTLILIIALCLNGFICTAQTRLSSSGKGRDVFPLVTPRSVATVCYDPDDYTVVGKSAGLFADDILEVTGKTMEVTAGSPADRYVVIAGTIEKNSYIRRLAEQGKIDILPGIGIEGSSLRLGNPTAPLQCYRDSNVPRVEYDFYTFNAGIVDVYTYVLPTFPLHAERDFKLPENNNSDTKYSVRIDDGSIATPSTSAGEYTQPWYESVLRNCRVNKSTLYVRRPGKHTLQIRCGDPGTVIQKIVIDTGGLSRSYLGPQSTKFVMKSNKKQHNN